MASIDSSGDPTRKYGTPNPNNKVYWTCSFCNRVLKRGAYRMKQHLVRGFRACTKCPKCPEHVRVEMKNYMLMKSEVEKKSEMIPQSQHHPIDHDEDDEDMETLGSSSKPKSVPPMKKMKDSYKDMIEEIRRYGLGLVPPSMYELRVHLLKKKVDEDIGKLLRIKNALKKCIFMNGYIYNRVSLVNMMRRFTSQRNLHWPTIIRFATSFITLAQYHKQKNNLKKMVTSEEWSSSKQQKDFYYANPEHVSFVEVEKSLYDCIERLSPDLETQDKIMFELDAYKNASGLFGNAMTIRHRKVKSLVDWWSCYGSSSLTLKSFAIKVLSLNCSATGCERNWGVFQHKRNRLAQTRLNDLIYVKYNQTLQWRYERKDTIDPILLDEIDESNEWLIRKINEDNSNELEDLVFDGDDLTWNVVSRAAGANESAYGVASNLRRLVDEIEDEDEDVLEDFGAEMEMEEEEDIGEDKDDIGDGDDEFYDDDY
ncbi:hypothetical protein C2S51_037505 [Perilla frutescens var. frutescens]|nr:hypothetical protein C2S51_037505 [Perilla frutescens var. frutescens]